MGLIQANKAERRRRILAAARRAVARVGFEGLTMRYLARTARVSVPTIYSLIGGKHALLGALLEDRIGRVAERVKFAGGESWVEKAMTFCQEGVAVVLEAPDYSRELVHLFLVLPETQDTRKLLDDHAINAIREIVNEGREAGGVVDWADSTVIAETQHASFLINLLAWAAGEGDDERFKRSVEFGVASNLLGVAQGDSAQELEKIARDACAALVQLRENEADAPNSDEES